MITICRDPEIVKMFMSLSEIWIYAAEHGSTINDLNANSDDRNVWLVYSIDGDAVGLTQLEIKNGAMAEFHPYILKAHKAHYVDMVKEVFQWFLDFVPDQIVKLNAYIPTHCKGALKAADLAGMKTEGTDRQSFLTIDGPCDRILKGITRREMSNE